MAEELFILMIALIVFAIILAIICIVLFIQIVKSDKYARPFLSSLFIYFLFLLIANIQQIIYNFLNYDTLILPSVPLQIYTTFFVYLLTFAAPIYLIFEIEKFFFPNTKITAKYHLTTVINVILFIVFVGNVAYLASIDIGVIVDFKIIDFIFIGGTLLGVEILFVIFAFLYLGIKSSEKYRLYALLITLGWLLNYGANAITTISTLPPEIVIILLIPKLLGVILTAIGLFQLYALKTV